MAAHFARPAAPFDARVARLRAATFPVAISVRRSVVRYAGAARVLLRAWRVHPIFSAHRRFPAGAAARSTAWFGESRTDFFRYRVRDRTRPPGRARRRRLRPHRLRGRTQLRSGGRWLRRAADIAGLSVHWESRPSISAAAGVARRATWLAPRRSCPFRSRRSPAPGRSARGAASGRKASRPDRAKLPAIPTGVWRYQSLVVAWNACRLAGGKSRR